MKKFLRFLTLVLVAIVCTMQTVYAASGVFLNLSSDSASFFIVANTENLPLYGRIIILDAGHGQGNSPRFAGYEEHVTMLALSRLIAPRLAALGADVRLTRPTPAYVQLHTRTAIINYYALNELHNFYTAKRQASFERSIFQLENRVPLTDLSFLVYSAAKLAEIDELLVTVLRVRNDPSRFAATYVNSPFDYTRPIHPTWRRVLDIQHHPHISERFLAISLHSNATPGNADLSANGASFYYASNTNPRTMNYYANFANTDASRMFGNVLLPLIDDIGIRNRGGRESAFAFVREHNVPAVLVENGFHTHERDRANLQNPDFLDRLADAYVEAILRYFEYVGPVTRLGIVNQ